MLKAEKTKCKVPHLLYGVLWDHKTFYKIVSSANCGRNTISILIFTYSHIFIFSSNIFDSLFLILEIFI